VEPLLSTADGEHSEHGVDVQSAVEVELKPDHECALLVINVELDVLELRPRHDLVAHQSLLDEWGHQEDGALVQ